MEENGMEQVENDEEYEDEPVPKKARMFSIKEFRENLYTENRDYYLKELHNICRNNDHKSIREFIETGGFSSELVNFIEQPNTPKATIMDIVAAAFTDICSGLEQHLSTAIKIAQQILDTHIALLNRMLGATSTANQRKAAFGLLAAIVPLSPKLAKDVLVHIDLNPKILELLMETLPQKDTLRNTYAQFLSGFGAHDHYPTIAALLEKRHLITGFTKGLKYDSADTVYNTFRFLTVDIVGNPLVSKTVKMKVFNTGVLKDVLHVYNWKGPGFDPNAKREDVIVKVDSSEKAKVLKGVHKFMMYLCTMPKYGIIFKDPQLGLGKKPRNRVLYTVLDVLESPWCNQLAQQLTIKICAACPDLTKYLWSLVKDCYYPRPAERSKIIEFSKILISELGPEQVMFAVKEMSAGHLAIVTQMLVAPSSVIETLLENEEITEFEVRWEVLELLSSMLNGIKRFLEKFEGVLTEKQYEFYKNSIIEYISKKFPSVDHKILSFTNVNKVAAVETLQRIFDVLNLYNQLCPQHLTSLSKIKLNKLLKLLRDTNNTDDLQVRFINLFLKYDQLQFLPETKQFSRIIKLLTQHYHESKNPEAYEALCNVFTRTSLFDSERLIRNSEYEIWVNSLLNVNVCNEDITNLFVTILQKASKDNVAKLKEILTESDLEHLTLSPFIFTLIESLEEEDNVSEEVKNYVDYLLLNLLYNQTDPNVLITILNKYKIKASDDILSYIFSFESKENNPVLLVVDSGNTRKRLEFLSQFSSAFINEAISAETFVEKFSTDDSTTKDALFNMCLFYISYFATSNKLTSVHTTNFEVCLKEWNNKKFIKVLLENTNVLKYFSPLKLDNKENPYGLYTIFITNIVKGYNVQESLLLPFQSKLFNLVQKLQKKSKYKNLETNKILDVVKTFNFNLTQSYEFLNVKVDVANFINDNQELSIIYHLYSYALTRLTELSINYNTDFILSGDTITYFVDVLVTVIERHFNTDHFVKPFVCYLKLYPHLIKQSVRDILFIMILKEQFSIENSLLVTLLLQVHFETFITVFLDNINDFNLTKGVILPILDICVSKNLDTDKLQILYDKFEAVLFKTLEKPHKAGEHFQKHYLGLCHVIKLFFPDFKCKSFMEKVHEFNISEPFFLHLLKTIYEKSITISETTEKHANNSILTFVNCFIHAFKQNREDYTETTSSFIEVLTILQNKNLNLSETAKNKNFRNFIASAFELGISGQGCLLKLLRKIVEVGLLKDELKSFMETIVNHSKLYDVIMVNDSAVKTELVQVMYEIFVKSPEIMEKSHIPIALAAYGATTRKSDRIVLAMLRLFEKNMMSNFHEFKPFLWGSLAANRYSIKANISTSLWRQPKTGAVLDSLSEDIVINTIKLSPLKLTLQGTDLELDTSIPVYDLSFLLPLFALLLAPENDIQTYRFTKSGAMSLTLLGLSSDDEEIRKSAGFVLSRFYHHVEARQNGKDNFVWLRFVEAVCRGTTVFEDFKINHMAAIFLARMALILTQPNHVMYVPLSKYLTAKAAPDFRSIPDWSALFRSSDVFYKKHHNFILRVMKDGMRTADDFKRVLEGVGFTSVMEYYTSVTVDGDPDLLVLEIFKIATNMKYAIKLLCYNYGLMSWLYLVFVTLDRTQSEHVSVILDIVENIVRLDEDRHLVLPIIEYAGDSSNLSRNNFVKLLRILCLVFDGCQTWLTQDKLMCLIDNVDNKECLYYLRYGIEGVTFDLSVLKSDQNIDYYLKYLTLKFIKERNCVNMYN